MISRRAAASAAGCGALGGAGRRRLSRPNGPVGAAQSRAASSMSYCDLANCRMRTIAMAMEKIENEVDALMEELEDNEALLQFEVQMGTSKMTSSEQSRAGAEKRLEDHRKNLQQKWEG